MKFNKLSLGCLAASAMLLAACSSEENIRVPENVQAEVFGNGSELVTLAFKTDDPSFKSRADVAHISDGSHANVLVFEVYSSETETGTYTLDYQFKKTTATVKGTGSNTSMTFGEGEGQNAVKVSSWPTVIQLATEKNRYYKVACWAQSTDATMFNSADLQAVTVDYGENSVNNDELRDAFCVLSNAFSGSEKREEIVLHRPFAQVNVGTSGADYNNLLQGPNVFPNKAIRYSQIQIKGVANKLNVVTGEAKADKDLGTITFKWAPLPAYYTLGGEVPQPANGDFAGEDFVKEMLKKTGEEFLVVRLNDPTSELKDYKTDYPTVTKDDNGKIVSYDTETFKYLSMCYILVPSAYLPEGGSAPEKTEAKTVLDEITVWFAENEDGKDNIRSPKKPEEGSEENEVTDVAAFNYFTLTNVPVQRNWRTNIIGGLSSSSDPGDDDTSLFHFTKICVHLCPIFDGEYNNVFSETTWVENEFPKYGDDDTRHDGYHDHENATDEEEGEEDQI